jgi:hypothetical protein
MMVSKKNHIKIYSTRTSPMNISKKGVETFSQTILEKGYKRN